MMWARLIEADGGRVAGCSGRQCDDACGGREMMSDLQQPEGVANVGDLAGGSVVVMKIYTFYTSTRLN